MSDNEYMPSVPELQEARISTYARDGQLTKEAILRGQREFKGWLAAHDRQVAANAWDEGLIAGHKQYMAAYPNAKGNPYRAASIATEPEVDRG